MSASDLLLKQRQLLIVQQLNSAERVIAVDLAREFNVSEDTIRRDLREMAAAGLCERVYGGALPVAAHSTSLTERIQVAPERKMRVAKAAVSVIEPGMFVFIDSGSTNMAIAKALPHNLQLTVATNSPAIAAVLIDRDDIDLVVIGGRIDRKVGGAIGGKAIRDAEAISPDLCILGACGLDKHAGVSAFDVEDAEFKRTIALRSRKILVAILNEKLGTAATFSVLPISGCDYLAVETDLDAHMVATIENGKTEIIRA